MHYFIKKEESKKENQDSEKSRKVSTIMTKLFLKMSYTDPLRDPNTDVTLMVDKQTKEILRYQSNDGNASYQSERALRSTHEAGRGESCQTLQAQKQE